MKGKINLAIPIVFAIAGAFTTLGGLMVGNTLPLLSNNEIIAATITIAIAFGLIGLAIELKKDW